MRITKIHHHPKLRHNYWENGFWNCYSLTSVTIPAGYKDRTYFFFGPERAFYFLYVYIINKKIKSNFYCEAWNQQLINESL